MNVVFGRPFSPNVPHGMVSSNFPLTYRSPSIHRADKVYVSYAFPHPLGVLFGIPEIFGSDDEACANAAIFSYLR